MLRFEIIVDYIPMFINGLRMTILVTVLSATLGSVLGLIMGIARLAKSRRKSHNIFLAIFVRIPSTIYVTFFRGTPLFVQVLLVHFALTPLLIHPIDGLLIDGELAREIRQGYGAFISGMIALSLNSGAYVTEIFRAGIQSIHKGQMEAARSSGLSYTQALFYVVVPQAWRRMLPPLGNEVITLLKDSSLVSAIGFTELAYAARTVSGAYSRYWEPYLTISAIYLVLTLLLAWGVSYLERKYLVDK